MREGAAVLLARLPIKVLSVGQGLDFGLVHHTTAVVGRGVEGRETHHFARARVPYVVPDTCGHEHGHTCTEHMRNTIHRGHARTLLATDKLVECVDLLTNVLAGLKAHDHELAVGGGIEHGTKRSVRTRRLTYIC